MHRKLGNTEHMLAVMVDFNVFNTALQLRLSTYNSRPLTPEDQNQIVTFTVSQQEHSPGMFELDKSANFERPNPTDLTFKASAFLYPNGNISVKTFQLPVPADGVIPFYVKLSENMAMLTIEVMRSKYDS